MYLLAGSDIAQRDRTIDVVVTGNIGASLPGFNKLSNAHQHRVSTAAGQHGKPAHLACSALSAQRPQPPWRKPSASQRPKEQYASYLVRTSLQRDTYNKQCNKSDKRCSTCHKAAAVGSSRCMRCHACHIRAKSKGLQLHLAAMSVT